MKLQMKLHMKMPKDSFVPDELSQALSIDQLDAAPVAASVPSKRNSNAVQMLPVTFRGCFGWLHYRPDLAAMDAGVVICPSLNRDALNAHFLLRVMADDMAAAGYKVLRFDYHSTGDSLDLSDFNDLPPGQWRGWQASIEAAADWMRDQAGGETGRPLRLADRRFAGGHGGGPATERGGARLAGAGDPRPILYAAIMG